LKACFELLWSFERKGRGIFKGNPAAAAGVRVSSGPKIREVLYFRSETDSKITLCPVFTPANREHLNFAPHLIGLAGMVQRISCTTLSTSTIKAARDGGATREATHPPIVRNHRGYFLRIGCRALRTNPVATPPGFDFGFCALNAKTRE
jgi:hypothetical protein